MTAEELREREFLERKAEEKDTWDRCKTAANQKSTSQKEGVGTKLSRGSGDTHPPARVLSFLILRRNPDLAQLMRNACICLRSKSVPGEDQSSPWQLLPTLAYEGLIDSWALMGLESPTPAPIHQVSQRLLLKGLRNQLPSTAKSPPHPSYSRPGPMATPHNKAKSPGVRPPGSSSSSALAA